MTARARPPAPPADPWVEWNRAVAAAHRGFIEATSEARKRFDDGYARLSAAGGPAWRAELVVLVDELAEADRRRAEEMGGRG